MEINPKVGFWINVVYLMCLALSGLGWATVFDQHTATIIVFALSGIAAMANTVLHGFSGPEKGPLAK